MQPEVEIEKTKRSRTYYAARRQELRAESPAARAERLAAIAARRLERDAVHQVTRTNSRLAAIAARQGVKFKRPKVEDGLGWLARHRPEWIAQGLAEKKRLATLHHTVARKAQTLHGPDRVPGQISAIRPPGVNVHSPQVYLWAKRAGSHSRPSRGGAP